MYYKSLTYSGVFEIRKHPNNDEYYLEQKEYLYKIPKKLYGGMDKYVEFYWNSFVRTNYTGGLILTGQKGSGKTMISATLCNLAISRGMQVIEITNVKFSTGLLRFLDELDNVVFFFDEFGKNFNNTEQDKMLTLLSDISGKERIVFITENVPHRISEFIRNRPGRVKYSLHFNKLPLKVVEEFCEEKGVEGEFYKEFLEAYKGIVTFQFDHLMAIVEEHLSNPTMEFNTLVELLNIDDMAGERTLIFLSASNKETGNDINLISCSPETMPVNFLERRGTLYVNLEIPLIKKDVEPVKQPGHFAEQPQRINLQLSKKNVTSMLDDMVIFESKNIELLFKIERR